MKAIFLLLSIACSLAFSSRAQTAPIAEMRTWTFQQDGKAEGSTGAWSFKKGGRTEAGFIRFSGTNRIVVKLAADSKDYQLPLTCLSESDRLYVEQFREETAEVRLQREALLGRQAQEQEVKAALDRVTRAKRLVAEAQEAARRRTVSPDSSVPQSGALREWAKQSQNTFPPFGTAGFPFSFNNPGDEVDRSMSRRIGGDIRSLMNATIKKAIEDDELARRAWQARQEAELRLQAARAALLEQQFETAKQKAVEAQYHPQSSGTTRDHEGSPAEAAEAFGPTATGTGFYVTVDGCLLTSQHVVAGAYRVVVQCAAGKLPARVVAADAANDLALLKVSGAFNPLPLAPSRAVKLGDPVFTVGFPNIDLQGRRPKLTKGEISSLAGAQDDPRHFQISVPVQPGNSGGPLVTEAGTVIGVIETKLSAAVALKTGGMLPENVNYALKSSYALLLLESVPDSKARLREAPTGKPRPWSEVVKEAEDAVALILAY